VPVVAYTTIASDVRAYPVILAIKSKFGDRNEELTPHVKKNNPLKNESILTGFVPKRYFD
jgi:hypothetical protein